METTRHIKWTRTVWLLQVCAVSFTAAAQDADREKKFSGQTEMVIRRQREAVRAELATLKSHPWAGKYHYGHAFLSITVELAPQNGYVYQEEGCVGIYDQNYGKIETKDGQLVLSLALPGKTFGVQKLAPRFIPVSWGERKYLVGINQMIEFCNAVNSGDEPRQTGWGNFLMAQGDAVKKAAAEPGVPAEYRKYLLKEPVNAMITRVGKLQEKQAGELFRTVMIGLNQGSDKGLFEGMRFYSVDRVCSGQITVKKLSPDSAEAEVTVHGEDQGMPKVGMKLSTLSQ